MSNIGTHLKNEIIRFVGPTKCAACEQTCELLNKMTVTQAERHQWRIIAKIEQNAMLMKSHGWKKALLHIDQSVSHGAGLRFVIASMLTAAIAKEQLDERQNKSKDNVLDDHHCIDSVGGTPERTE